MSCMCFLLSGVAIAVALGKDTVFVRCDVTAIPGLITQTSIDAIRDQLSEMLEMPVVLEFGIIPETFPRSTEKDKS